MSRITAAWAAASRGKPGVLLLVGDAGIGKTRLAAAATATAEAMTSTPESIGGAVAAALDRPVQSLPVETGGARRAAALIADLLE